MCTFTSEANVKAAEVAKQGVGILFTGLELVIGIPADKVSNKGNLIIDSWVSEPEQNQLGKVVVGS